ncbi:MAG: chorismate synthase [Clostridia bacterium]|nr:chorismate synthase [Clostridia bacterium]
MSSNIGRYIKMQIFGESHGKAIGVVIDGIPHGIKLDMDAIAVQMARRAPGNDKTSTPRKEADIPEIISGVLNGVTTGAPLCAMIVNSNTRSRDYSNLVDTPRPSHADYPANIRFNGYNDLSGSGHFSGRLTAPMVFAGAVCRQILKEKGITVGGHIYSIGEVKDTPFDMVNVDENMLEGLNCRAFSVIDEKSEKEMRDVIEKARMDRDSVGGVCEVAVTGIDAGNGDVMFGSVESRISEALFGVPAVKGVEFGAGFDISKMRGSEVNDCYCIKDGKIATKSNNNGGILGGLTNGMPIIVRAALKPTPSISKEQKTLNTKTLSDDTLIINGRHDPCVVGRALPVIESMVCFILCDILKGNGKI